MSFLFKGPAWARFASPDWGPGLRPAASRLARTPLGQLCKEALSLELIDRRGL